MSFHHGFLYLVDRVSGVTTEVFNHARTLDAINMGQYFGLQGFYNIDESAVCENYRWVPDCTTGTFSYNTYGMADTETEAPWYDASIPASADGLGFWIEEWTGLDSAHVASSATPVGRNGGGSYVGPRGGGGRTMSLNVLLIGMDEPALVHMFRWLESLLNSMTDNSATTDMFIREWCAEDPDSWEGIARIEHVAAISGLTWVDSPTPRGGCVIRRASLTIEAEDPCMYRSRDETSVLGSFNPAVGDYQALSDRSCQPTVYDTDGLVSTLTHLYLPVDAASVGMIAPIVDLDYQSALGQPIEGGPVLLQVYASLDTTDDWRYGLPLIGQMGFRAVTVESQMDRLTLRYDAVRRTVLELVPGWIGWQSGWRWTTPPSGIGPWFGGVTCRGFHVVLLPMNPCDWPASPSINVSATLGERVSCA